MLTAYRMQVFKNHPVHKGFARCQQPAECRCLKTILFTKDLQDVYSLPSRDNLLRRSTIISKKVIKNRSGRRVVCCFRSFFLVVAWSGFFLTVRTVLPVWLTALRRKRSASRHHQVQSELRVAVYPSKGRPKGLTSRLFTQSGTERWRGSGDLHSPDADVLIKTLINKKEKKKPGTCSALKNVTSPCVEREFTPKRPC